MNEIHDLLERIETPTTDVSADVGRGERALRRRHRVQASAAAAAVVAVVAGGVALRGGGPGTEAGYSGDGSVAPSPTHPTRAPSRQPSTSLQPRAHHGLITAQERQHQLQQQIDDPRTDALLQGYRDVLADHLGSLGVLGPANGEWGRGRGPDHSLGTHIDWNHGGEIMVGVATSWGVTEWPYYPGHGTEIRYQGHRARILVDGVDLYVSVEHDNGQVVTVTASATFGNNHTSIPSTGLTVQDLLPAAADSRVTMPDWVV
jgi:hypothetical protein